MTRELTGTSRRTFVAAGSVAAVAAVAALGEGTAGAQVAGSGLETVNSIAELRQHIPATAASSVVVLGYYGPGDGGGGLFTFIAGSTAAVDDGIVVATASTWPHGVGQWVRSIETADVSVAWFGANSVANSGAPVPPAAAQLVTNKTAFERAIRSLTPDLTPDYRGGTVVVPPGLYDFAATLVVDRSVVLVGSGSGHGPAATRLRFPGGAVGVDVVRNLPVGTPPPLNQQPRGDGAVIEGMRLIGRPGGPNAHGVRVKGGRVTLRNLAIRGFGGDGVNIVADVPASAANGWRIDSVEVSGCENGFHFGGDDSNAGLATGLDASGNRGWGISDMSFLGNTFVGCHTASNNGGSYRATNNNARSLFVGCYAETDQTAANVTGPSMIIGGLFGKNDGNGVRLSPDARGVLRLDRAVSVVGGEAADVPAALDELDTVALGGPTEGSLLEFTVGGESRPVRLKYEAEDRPNRGWFHWNWANTLGGTALGMTTKVADEWMEKAAETAKAWLPNGLYLGRIGAGVRDPAKDGRVYMTAGKTFPTTGTWSRGDRILNNAPVVNHPTLGYLGWICVTGSTGGNAGEWIPFGALSS